MCDDSTTYSSADQCSNSAASTYTETSAGNTSLSTLKVYQLEAEGTSHNYRGPKVIIKMKLWLQYVQPTQLDTSKRRKLLK
eukprot:12272526-Ditylum_brightwellii.AAC.1